MEALIREEIAALRQEIIILRSELKEISGGKILTKSKKIDQDSITISEAAKALNKGRTTIVNMIKDGLLDAYKPKGRPKRILLASINNL